MKHLQYCADSYSYIPKVGEMYNYDGKRVKCTNVQRLHRGNDGRDRFLVEGLVIQGRNMEAVDFFGNPLKVGDTVGLACSCAVHLPYSPTNEWCVLRACPFRNTVLVASHPESRVKCPVTANIFVKIEPAT